MSSLCRFFDANARGFTKHFKYIFIVFRLTGGGKLFATKMKFIVEHMEEELFPWCMIEYKRICRTVGHENFVVTNLATVQEYISEAQSILSLGIPFDRICLLDSEATQELSPEDAQDFDYFLLGGILGNVDEFDMDRTALLRQHGFPTRNLGHMQMTTDTAVKTAHIILTKALYMNEIPFIDRPELIGPTGQKFVSDFRYLTLSDGQPDIDPEILREMERDFEFNLLE